MGHHQGQPIAYVPRIKKRHKIRTSKQKIGSHFTFWKFTYKLNGKQYKISVWEGEKGRIFYAKSIT